MVQTIMYCLSDADRNLQIINGLYDAVECVRIFDGLTFGSRPLLV